MQTATEVRLKASDLRVGNWVLSALHGDNPKRIEGIYKERATEGNASNFTKWGVDNIGNTGDIECYYVVQFEKRNFTAMHNSFKEFDENEKDYIQPVILTHQILESCGFIKKVIPVLIGKKNSYCLDVLILTPFGSKYDVYTNLTTAENEHSVYGYITGNAGIKYLHQLQNLYHSLTSEELEVNL